MHLLQPPQLIELLHFTSLPTEFRQRTRSVWADANRAGRATNSFLEGPVFDDAGNLYVSDIPFGRIFRIEAQGRWTLVAEYDGEPNGMKFLDDRTLLITDYKNGLMRLDIASAKTEPFLERRNTERFRGVNDLVFDSAGNHQRDLTTAVVHGDSELAKQVMLLHLQMSRHRFLTRRVV